MKIAVTSDGSSLQADIDPRFGRALNFIIVDPETLDYEVIENKQNLNLAQGAGIQASKTIVDSKAEVLITGNCGPKAFHVLSTAGVKVITGISGRVIDGVQRYKNGELQPTNGPSVDGHWV